MGAHDELNTAWVEFCDSLKAAGAAVLASHHASDDVSAAEGMRHLARMVSMSLTQWIDFSDTSDPRLFRSNDDVWQWGGPNVDNVYIGAPLDPTGTYRLTGDVSGQPGAVLQVLGQPSGDDPIAVRVDRSLAGGVDGTGRVDLVLSGDESVDADVRLPADSKRLVLREYLPSLDSRRAGFDIERLDARGVAPDCSPAKVAGSLMAARMWLSHNIGFWQDYTDRRLAEVGENAMEAPHRGPGMGSESIAYSTGFFSLSDDECMVVSMRVPQAPYWAIQLYSRGWYESLDVTRRRTSLNNTQTVVDDDGVVRWVIATRDPGCANWLDAGGHPAGMIHFRAVWCDELPEVASEVVPLSRLGDVLPSSHPKADFDDRLADLRVRRATSRRRFAR